MRDGPRAVITDSCAPFKTFENHGEFQSFQRFAPFETFEGGGPPNFQDRLGGPSLISQRIATSHNCRGAQRCRRDRRLDVLSFLACNEVIYRRP